MTTVVFTNEVQIKLSGIFDYIAPNTGFDFALSHIETIENEIVDKLSHFPRSGEPYRSDFQRKTTVKAGNAYYTVLYQFHEKQDTVSVYQIYGKGEDW